MIQTLRQEHSLALLLDIAQLPRATFYYHLKQMQKADKYASVKEEITAIYHENEGRYGYRRITIELRSKDLPLNHKTVQRLMKELGLVCRVRMKKYCSYNGKVGKIAPNLLNRDFHADKPNQKWVTDVTEFRLFGEKLYLSPILDLHSSDLVSYTISDRPVLSMVTSMLDKAFARNPNDTNLIRDRYAAEHPLCEMCLKEGRLTPVQEVHHILPVSKGSTHARDNLMSLCQSCHTKIHHGLGDR